MKAIPCSINPAKPLPTMVKQSTKPKATAYPESPRLATQERATTAQPTWP
jgi:hypothetical protein